MPATTTRAQEDSPSVKRRTLWLIPITLAVAVLLIILLVIVFSSDGPGVADQRQLASVQQVCKEWSGNSAPGLGTGSAISTCTTMADWMGQQLQDGHMTGAMMWGTATVMDSVCRQWMDTASRSSVSAVASPGWCDDMVNWMEQRVGNWGDWMMNGNMMGGD